MAVDRTLVIACSFLLDLMGDRDTLFPFCCWSREGVFMLLVSRDRMIGTFSLAEGTFVLQ